MTQPTGLRGKRALVYSLGIEGRDLAAWLVAQGARVTISDTRNDEALAATGASPPEGVECVVTGQPLLDPAGFDLVAVSQSILRSSPAMERVRRLGIPFTSQMRLFLQLCPARDVIGITGASGKSTTTALVAAMAASAGRRHVVGGNIGVGAEIGPALLQRVSDMDADTLVILEISHTQLQYTDRSPTVAAITNVTPNHLDQFSWEEYVALKRHLLEYQGPGDAAVLNGDDETSRALIPSVRGSLWRTSLRGPLTGEGAWAENGRVIVRKEGLEQAVAELADSPLRGAHNQANIVMACAIARAVGIPAAAIASAVKEFRGVPHRLEVVGTALGATWVNDSIATTPERTVAGLSAFSEPVILLLGGREKHLPVDRLRTLAGERCRAVICFGEAGDLFREAVGDRCARCLRVETLPEAVAAAAGEVRRGDVVLLSPAATSFDAYPNFEVRGQAFRELVRALPGFAEVGP